jgi:hypothetical protein
MVHEEGRETRWTFLTGHGHALIVITRNPNTRLREIAADLGVTERTAQTIVNDLVDAGYLARTRIGNRSRYEVRMERPFRHPVERDHAVGELLGVLATPGNTAGAAITHAAADSHARQQDQ